MLDFNGILMLKPTMRFQDELSLTILQSSLGISLLPRKVLLYLPSFIMKFILKPAHIVNGLTLYYGNIKQIYPYMGYY